MSQVQYVQAAPSKGLAFVLALILGGLGIHRFYMGHMVTGLFYLVFCWTLVPLVLACIDCVRILLSTDNGWRRWCGV